MLRDLLYRLIAIVWALFAKLAGGKLPDGVQFVPSSPAPSSPASAPADSTPSSSTQSSDVLPQSSESTTTPAAATGQHTAGAM
jgi:hypothetical protein